MTTPKRYSSGVTNVGSGSNMGQFLAPDPTKVHMFFDDFNFFDETDAVVWDIAATTGSIVLADGDGGTILLTTKASDGSLAQLATMNEIFTMETGKKMWFKVRIVDQGHATNDDCVLGLHVDDQTPLAGAPASGVYFRKDEATTEWDFQVMNTTSVLAINNIGTCTTGAITLGFYFDGTSQFEVYVDDALVGTGATTSFPTTELGVAITAQNGDTSAATMTIDYILAAKER